MPKVKDGDSFHLPFLHAGRADGDMVGTNFGIGETDQDLIAAFDCGPFKIVDDLGEKGIAAAQLRYDQADGVTTAARQGASLKIRQVANLFNHSLNAANKSGVDRFDVIDHPGDSGMRDTRAAGNVHIQRLSDRKAAVS